MQDLYNTTPVYGRWLADIPQLEHLEFSVLKTLDMPECDYHYADIGNIWADAERWAFDFRQIHREDLDYCIPDTYVDFLHNFSFITHAIRRHYIKSKLLFDWAPLYPEWDNIIYIKDSLFSDQKKLNFLYMARLIVHGGESLEEVAKEFGIGKLNLRIILSCYLTLGTNFFTHSIKPHTDRAKYYMVEDHICYHQSIPYVCATYGVLDRNLFKRWCRDYRRKRLHP